jgi:saccharopine dehydrogenase-like NADP-dependent oxidoreductase
MKLATAGSIIVLASRSQEKLDAADPVIRGEVETRLLDFTNEASTG